MAKVPDKPVLDDREVCIQLEVIRDQQLKVLQAKAGSRKMCGWLAALISIFDDVLYLYKSP